MVFDQHSNFAYSTVVVAPLPATSGASLTVVTGNGSLFPTPPFNATMWPAGIPPTNSNAEVVRITAVASDTFTITRAQEGTSAQPISAGYQIAATMTAKTFTDIEAFLANNKLNIPTGSNASAGTGTLSGGTVTISTTAVTASSLIFLTDTASSITNVGALTVSAKVAGTSFTVTSTLALDTSTFNWLIVN